MAVQYQTINLGEISNVPWNTIMDPLIFRLWESINMLLKKLNQRQQKQKWCSN